MLLYKLLYKSTCAAAVELQEPAGPTASAQAASNQPRPPATGMVAPYVAAASTTLARCGGPHHVRPPRQQQQLRRRRSQAFNNYSSGNLLRSHARRGCELLRGRSAAARGPISSRGHAVQVCAAYISSPSKPFSGQGCAQHTTCRKDDTK